MSRSTKPEIKNLHWAIEARARSQRLLLALYEFVGERDSVSLGASEESKVFGSLVGVAFSLWRAAFLADMPTRTWEQALEDTQELLAAVLTTNTIAFTTEYKLQGWTGGFYLTNARLRLESALGFRVKSGHATAEDVDRVRAVTLFGTDPRETWKILCLEAEALARAIGCKLPPDFPYGGNSG